MANGAAKKTSGKGGGSAAAKKTSARKPKLSADQRRLQVSEKGGINRLAAYIVREDWSDDELEMAMELLASELGPRKTEQAVEAKLGAIFHGKARHFEGMSMLAAEELLVGFGFFKYSRNGNHQTLCFRHRSYANLSVTVMLRNRGKLLEFTGERN